LSVDPRKAANPEREAKDKAYRQIGFFFFFL